MKVSHHGLRATDAEYALGKLNLFRGPYGSGKSTALDAVALAALGFVPRVGRTGAALARLTRGEGALVRLELNDGRTIARGVPKEPGEKSGCQVSWLPKAKLTEAQTAAAALFGATLDEAERFVDIRTLLKLSGRERAKVVDALLDSVAPQQDSGARVRRLLAARLAAVAEDRVPDDPAGQAKLSGSPVFDAVASAVAETVARNGLAAAIETAKTEKNEAAARSRAKVNARGELEARSAGATSPAESEADLRAARDAAVSAAAAAKARLDAAAAQDAAVQEALAALTAATFAAEVERPDPAKLRAEAAAARDAADALKDPPPPPAPEVEAPNPGVAEEADRLRAVAARDAAEADAVVDPPRPMAVEPSDAAKARRAERQAFASDMDARAKALLESLPAESPAFKEAEEATSAGIRLRGAESSPWREVESIADEVEECGRAYEDGVIHQHALKLRALAKRHGGDFDAAQQAYNAASKALQAAIERRDAIDAQRAAAIEEMKRLRAAAKKEYDGSDDEWSAAVIDASRESLKAEMEWSDACAAAKAKRDELRRSADAARKAADALVKQDANAVFSINAARRANHRGDEAAWRSAVEENAAARSVYRAHADALERRAAEVEREAAEAAAAVREAAAKIDGLVVAEYDTDKDAAAVAESARVVAECDAKLAALGAASARKSEMRALLAEIDRADADREAWAAAEWALGKVRDEAVQDRVGPLVAKMAVFLRGAGHSETPYVSLDGGATDFGWKNAAGERVSLDGALSGHESVLLLSALQCAVVSLARPEVRVLLVEAAEAHGKGAAELLAGCEAVKDWFDAILVAGPEAMPTREGWTVFDFAATAAGGGQ